jgi:PAS domain S-box-containing protein
VYIKLFIILLLPFYLISEQITVLTLDNYFPYSYRTGSKYAGYNIDLLKEIFKDRNYSIKIEAINSIDKGIIKVGNGEADLIFGVTFTNEQDSLINFSESYIEFEYAVAKLRSNKLQSLDDISPNDIVGIKDGDYSYHYMHSVADSFRVAPISDIESSLILLNEDKIVAMVGERRALNGGLERTNLHEKIKILDNIEFSSLGRIGIKKQDEELKSFIDKRLSSLKESGFLSQLNSRWLRDGELSSISLIINYSVGFLLIILLVIVYKISKDSRSSKGRLNLFKSVLKTIPDFILETDRDLVIKREFSGDDIFYKRHKELFSSTGSHLKDIFEDKLFAKIERSIKVMKDQELNEHSFEYIIDGRCLEEFRVLTIKFETFFIIIKDKSDLLKAKLELEERETRYSTIVNNLPGAAYRIVVENGEKRYQFISDNITNITGKEVELFMKEGPDALLSMLIKEDIDHLRSEVKKTPEESVMNSTSFEYRIVDNSGKVRWINERSRICEIKDGVIVIDGIYFDITEKKEIETGFEESKLLYKSIIDNSTDGIIVISKREFKYANSAFKNITGFRSESLADLNLSDVISDDYIDQINNLLMRISIKPMSVKNLVVSMIHKSGNPIWAELSFIPIRWQDENSIMIFIVDQTQKRNDEKEIFRVKEYQNYILNTIPQGLITTDERGRIIHTNRGVQKLFKMRSKDFDGLLYFEAIKSLAQLHRYFFEVVDDNRSYEFSKFKFDEVEDRFFNIKLFKFLEDENSGLIIQIDDVTEIEKKELQLIQAQKMETVGTLAGGLAHDFNNVLGGIIGTLSIMRFKLKKGGSLTNDQLNGYLDTLERSSQNSSEMVKQLLTLSRKQDISFAPMDINKTVNHVVKILRSSFDKSVELDIKILDKAAKINGDPVQLEQVILNLSVNAGHAMTIMRGKDQKWGGRLTIEVSEHHVGSNFAKINDLNILGDYIVVSIKDNGVGISKENITKIFDPFFTTKDKDRGTGLGLSMVYSIIKQHNGNLKLKSEVGVGTTFKLFIPKLEDETDLLERSENSEIPMGEGSVLIVDDEELMRMTSKSILEECGYRVLTAENGEVGFNLYRERADEIDLVILDMVMPVLSGKECLEKIRGLDPNQKVILASGLKQDQRVQDLLDLGKVEYIQKPFTLEVLANRVNDILNQSDSKKG